MKYFLTTKEGKRFAAQQVELINDYQEQGIELFIHQSFYNEGWAITEMTTGGKVVGNYEEKADAIAALRDLIDRVGIDRVIQECERKQVLIKQLKECAK